MAKAFTKVKVEQTRPLVATTTCTAEREVSFRESAKLPTGKAFTTLITVRRGATALNPPDHEC